MYNVSYIYTIKIIIIFIIKLNYIITIINILYIILYDYF